MAVETSSIYNSISSRLASVRRKENVAGAVQGLLLAAFCLVAGLMLALLLENLFYFPPLVRTLLFWAIVLGTVGVFAWRAGVPLLRVARILPQETDEATAAKVGHAFPSIKDRLVNILQLFSERAAAERSGRQLYSVELIDASFDDLRRAAELLDFNSIVDYTGSRRMSRFLVGAVAVAVLLFVLFPTPFFGSAYRLWNYNQAFAAPAPFRLIVLPGNRDIVKGENVTVTVRVEGEPQKEITLVSRPEGQTTDEEHTLTPSAPGEFRYEFVALKSTTRYAARSGSVSSDEYMLTVADRPVVRLLRLSLAFPSYTKLPGRELEDNTGDVTALKGTRVSFSVETNKDLVEAAVVFNDSARLAMNVKGSKASATSVLMKERSYHLLLKDKEGVENAEPIEYAMHTVPDAYPTISILMPGQNLDITDNTTIPLLIKITDDYGFNKLRLAYKLVQSRYEKPATEFTFVPIPLPPGVGTDGNVAYTWALDGLHLAPEDIISYYVEVFDNDNVSGPKSAMSEIYSLRLPSLDEVFADVDKGHEMSLDAMKDVQKTAEQAKKDLEELQRDLNKNRQKMDWQDQKKAEDLVQKYAEMQKKMEEVKQTVDKMVDQMQMNQVLSPETLQKYQELQQLMQEMDSPEFAEAMKKLQQSMQQMNPEAMKQAMQQFQFNEENFRKNIERTMNLMKRLQIEQKVDEAVKRAEELRKQQEDLQHRTEKTNPQDRKSAEELAKQQKDLQEQMAKMQKELEELQKKMEEFPSEMPLSEMEKLNKELQQNKLQEQLGQIAQQLQQQQNQQAMQNQQQASQKMSQMSQQLQNMKQAMQQNQQKQIVNEMRRTTQDLLELSRRQEALKNESKSLDPNSPQFRKNAEQQMNVLRDLGKVTDRLSGLSQKTFGVTPEMGKSIGDAMRNMSEAMKSLQERNGSAAGQQQSGAMASLNETARLVQSAMEGMMQGGGQGMGMAGFMQRLQQMSGQQQGINQGTQNLGQMSQQQAAEMARLAGEQGMVRKSMEQLAKEAAASGDLKRMLGDLGNVAQEMREVQTDLAQGNVNPETLQKQERILSRLLDSQRSARERDYEKRRQSSPGQNVASPSPGQIELSTQEGRNKLRRDLLKALEQGYSRDYEELIRKYFDALEQEQTTTPSH
jgi:hypothetical protein